MNYKKVRDALGPVAIALLLLIILAAFTSNLGVTNFGSLHLSDINLTGTPILMANQRGTGNLIELQDSATPVFQLPNGGNVILGTGVDLNGQTMILDADADTNLAESADDTIDITLGAATGSVDILTGNLVVGNGTPDFTQDGEDAYVEGTLETAGNRVLGAEDTFAVTLGIPITATGFYQPITSTTVTQGGLVSDIAAGTTTGQLLLLHNLNASQAITIDGTGATVECQADVVLGAQDTLLALWNGTDWICLSSYDN